MFSPRPYWLAVACSLLVVVSAFVLLTRYRSLVQLETKHNALKVGVDGMFILPALALLLRGYLDAQLVSWTWLIAPSAVAAVAAGAFIYRVEVEPRWFVAVMFGVLLGAGFGGTIALGNRLLDRSAGEPVRTIVTDRRIVHDRSVTHKLTVTGGPWPEAHDVEVSEAKFERSPVGSVLELEVRQGAFRSPWWLVTADCDPKCR